MKPLQAVLLVFLFLASLVAQQPSAPQASSPTDSAMQAQAMAALKLVDEYKAEAEKNGKTDAPSETQKQAELAINNLPDVTLCSVSSRPKAARLMTGQPPAESCGTLRSRLEILLIDARKIALSTTQFQMSPRDDVSADLTRVAKQYEADRAWVLATIDRWKKANA